MSSLWSRLEDGFPTASYGFQVLNSLREVEFDIHQPTSILDGWENSTWPKTPPTFVDIMMDTASAKKVEDITFFDTFSGTLEAQIEGETEEVSFVQLFLFNIINKICRHSLFELGPSIWQDFWVLMGRFRH